MKATGSTPRTSTFSRVPASVWRKGWFNISGDASGVPSGARATPVSARSACAASRGTTLAPSLVAPLRSTIRLSGSPVEASMRCSPPTSAASSMVAATTMATPPMVNAVVQRRTAMLRRL